jgi:Domain of unknown function (DUF4834)
MNLFIILYLFNFLRTLLIIVILYYGIRLVVRYLFPMLLDRGMKNMQRKMQDQQRNQQRSSRREGEVTLEGQPNKGKKSDRGSGEYVDFEEVDE